MSTFGQEEWDRLHKLLTALRKDVQVLIEEHTRCQQRQQEMLTRIAQLERLIHHDRGKTTSAG